MGFSGADMSGQNRGPARRLTHIAQWLDYSLEMGCSGLLLGPIFASASHGYDTIDYLTIDPRLGDDADFDRLVEAARSRGIRILLDGVFNHVGEAFPRFEQALREGPQSSVADWFHLTWPAGSAPEHESFEGHDDLVALNHESPAVVDFAVEVMNHWLDKGVDGWRLDAAYAVPPSFWEQVLARVRERHPDAYIVGEVIHGDYSQIVAQAGLDSVTQYELWKAIWSSINDLNFFELAWAIERHDEYLETFVPLTFLGNHDVTRIASQIADDRHHAHALAILMAVGGTPSIYYGDEQAFQGVKEERFGGDDEIRPQFPADVSELAQFGWPSYRLHQELIGLRRRHPWLHRARIEVLELANQQFLFRTAADGEQLVVALNLGEDEWRVDIGAGHTVQSGSPGAEVSGSRLTVDPHGWAFLDPAEPRSSS
ncbi:MAG: alpha-amylase family glycosyl hydrolase [Candidatus Nanopelagicales bacterium]